MSLSELDLVVAGSQEGGLVVESEASELTEKVMLGAVTFGHREYQKVIDAIIELAEMCARDPREIGEEPAEYGIVRQKLIDAGVVDELSQAYRIVVKQDRYAAVAKAKEKVLAALGDDALAAVFPAVFKHLESDIVRGNILETGIRIDGRDTKSLWPSVADVGVPAQDRR